MKRDARPAPAASDREQFLESLLASLTDHAVVTVDLAGRVTAWNEGARQLFGWDGSETLGRAAATFVVPDDGSDRAWAAETQAALRGERVTGERWLRRKDGSRFLASGSLLPLRGEDGAVRGVVSVLRDRTPQHRAGDRQLADSEFLRSVLASSGDCLKVLDLDANLMFMNESGQRLMEVSDFNDIEGCAWPDFWTDDKNLEARAAVAVAQAGGRGTFQGVANTVAGTPKWWDVQVTPIRGSDGQPEKLLAVSRDITATRLAERALREAQALNTLILDASQDCIVVLDLEGRTQFVNPGGIAAMEIADPEAIIGLSWLRVWGGADHVAATAAVAQAREGGVGRFQGFCPTHAGTPKWWDVVISSLPGPDGRPQRLVSIGRDITGLRQAERQLALSRERLDLALGASDAIGTWDWDMDAGLVYADANAARLHGIDRDQAAAGSPSAEYLQNIHPDDTGELRQAIARALAGADEFACEYRVTQRDGSTRWLLARGRLVRDAEGVALRLPGASVDITERKLAEEHQHLLMQELAHRVKNTLALVQAIASQTLRGEGSLSEARRAFAARLMALAQAHDVLLQGSWTGADLRGLVEGVVRLLGHDEPGRFSFEGDDVTLGPRAALSFALVLHELGTNAVKYGALSTPDGHVTASWRCHVAEGEAWLRFQWREVGGPPVPQVRHQGFGTRLIERSLTQGLGATAQLDYPVTGVTFAMAAPLAALQRS